MTLFPVTTTPVATDLLYPAFESSMGETLVREVDDQADNDELWRRAVALQLVLDRIAGVR